LARLSGAADAVRALPDDRADAVPLPAPESADWRAWDPRAGQCWALRWEDLPADPDTAASILDERVDDERARQDRLVWWDDEGGSEADVMLCHLPRDLPAARQIAAELATIGIRVWVDEAGSVGSDPTRAALADLAVRVGVVAVLVSPVVADRWDELPVAALYAAVRRRAATAGRRLRWLPVRLPGVERTDRVPEFLHSFDWFSWPDRPGPESRAARAALASLLGGVVVDRARS
jgi:hypothetical protein